MSDPDNVLFWIAPRNGLASKALGNISNRNYVSSIPEPGQAFVVALNGCKTAIFKFPAA
jgi:hypothetical protein